MKVAVIYWSGTGNTEQMAQAIAEGAGADLFAVSDFSGKLDVYDRVAFGCSAMGDEVLEESEFEPFFAEVEGELSGKTIALSALKPGYKIGLVVNGDQVAAIEVQQAVTSGSQLNGTVVYVSTERGNQYIYLRSLDSAGNEELITVHVDDDTKFLEWDGGTLTLRKLEVGDYLQVNGAYDGAEFNASLILRQ